MKNKIVIFISLVLIVNIISLLVTIYISTSQKYNALIDIIPISDMYDNTTKIEMACGEPPRSVNITNKKLINKMLDTLNGLMIKKHKYDVPLGGGIDIIITTNDNTYELIMISGVKIAYNGDQYFLNKDIHYAITEIYNEAEKQYGSSSE